MSNVRRYRHLVVVAVGVIAGSCKDTGGPEEPQVPTSLSVHAGNAQQAVVGTQLPNPIVARVLDQNGQPISGQLVNFVVKSGGGSVFAGSAISNANGLAQELWTLGTSTAVEQSVEARAVDPETGAPLVFATFLATALPDVPASISNVSGSGQSVVAGAPIVDSLLVLVVDQYDNPASGVTVTWSAPTAAGTLSNSSSITSATGHASTKFTAGTVAGPYAVTATVNALATTFDIIVTAGPAARITKMAGDNQTVSAGGTVPVRPSVRVYDANDNVVSGVQVTFVASTGGGSVTGGTVTTDAGGNATVGSWRLGSSTGANSLTASVGTASATFTATASQPSTINISLLEPTNGRVVNEFIEVDLSVTSLHAVASVTATVGSVQVDISRNPQGRYKALVPTQGLASGPLVVTLSARDVNGGAADSTRAVILDRRPAIVAGAIDSGSVVRGLLTFSADCTDDDPVGCKSITLKAGLTPNGSPAPQVLATGVSHIGGSVSLAQFDGKLVGLTFTAVDSRNQVTEEYRWVNVESNTSLPEITTVPGIIRDLSGDRVLYSGPNRTLYLKTISTAASEAIYAEVGTGKLPTLGFVSPTGAIFVDPVPTSPGGRLLEWRNSTLLELAGVDTNRSLRVAGNYASFSEGTWVTRRDLLTGTSIVITTTIGARGQGHDVAANGDVVFTDNSSNNNIRRFRDGSVTLLTPPEAGTSRWYNRPLTDGVNVVFHKLTSGDPDNFTSMHDGTQVIQLTPTRVADDYAINGGWIAFGDANTTARQIWRRSPAGVVQQATSFGVHSFISALGPDGTLIVTAGDRRYRIRVGGTPEDIMSSNGQVIWRDNQFVALVGNTAFAIAP